LQGRVRNNQTRIDKEEEEEGGGKKCSSRNKKIKIKKEKSSSFRYFDPLRSDDSVLIVDVFL
jgi:hypothetical protein